MTCHHVFSYSPYMCRCSFFSIIITPLLFFLHSNLFHKTLASQSIMSPPHTSKHLLFSSSSTIPPIDLRSFRRSCLPINAYDRESWANENGVAGGARRRGSYSDRWTTHPR